MNTIRFMLKPRVCFPQDIGVGIWVDGESLIELVCGLERSWWTKRGLSQPAEQYVWAPARSTLLPSRHLLGEPANPDCGGFSAVVVCKCGYEACRSYAVRIEASANRVEWTSWAEVPAKEARGVVKLLRPFAFEREQYEAELFQISEAYRTAQTR